MATIGTLVVNLQVNQSAFITQMNQAAQTTARATRQMQTSLTQFEQSLHRVGRALGTFITVRFLAQSVREVGDYADAWKLATNQVAAGAAVSGQAADSLEAINAIAIRTRTSLAETAELYGKMIRATANLSVSQGDVAKATEIVNKAFKAGGASVQEQVNGIRQLAQSLSSGIFQGDELRSIRENAPLLARAIAEEFNTTIGGLKKLGAEGALTADRVFRAILKNSEPIERAFAATNATIADSFTVINNAITQYVGHIDSAVGASKGFAAGALLLAKNFDTVAESALGAREKIQLFIDIYRNFQTLIAGGKANVKENSAASEIVHQFSLLIEQLGGVKEAILGTDNPLSNFIGRLGGIFHPMDAFLTQIKDAIAGINSLIGATDRQDKALQALAHTAATTTVVPKTTTQPLIEIPTITPEYAKNFAAFLKEVQDGKADIQDAAIQQTLLTAAAKEGSDAFDVMTDVIGAMNDVISKGIPLLSTAGKEAFEMALNTRMAARAAQDLSRAIDDTVDKQREAQQSMQLLQEGQTGSADAVRQLKEHFDLLNEAASKNIDLTTQEGQAWLAAAEKAQKLGDQVKQMEDRLDATAGMINSVVSGAINGVSSSFANAVVEGEKFMDMLDALLKDLARLALNAVFQLFLQQLIGGVGTTGAAGTGLLGGLLGGGSTANIGQGGLPLVPGGTFGDTIVPQAMGSTITFHGGGIVGKDGTRRMSSVSFANAPRFHRGLQPGEFPAVLQRGEGVFTPDQMKALGGKVENNFNVINQVPNTFVEQKRETNDTGGVDMTVLIRQTMTKEITDPASVVHRSMKASFGLTEANIRR